MCNFQYLFKGNEGYIVRCKDCGQYQLAFGTTMLTLTQLDYETLYGILESKSSMNVEVHSEHTKCMIIPTPAYGLYLILTKKVVDTLCCMLEKAECELKALSLLSLFNN